MAFFILNRVLAIFPENRQRTTTSSPQVSPTSPAPPAPHFPEPAPVPHDIPRKYAARPYGSTTIPARATLSCHGHRAIQSATADRPALAHKTIRPPPRWTGPTSEISLSHPWCTTSPPPHSPPQSCPWSCMYSGTANSHSSTHAALMDADSVPASAAPAPAESNLHHLQRQSASTNSLPRPTHSATTASSHPDATRLHTCPP